jgi:hypothetical protein
MIYRIKGLPDAAYPHVISTSMPGLRGSARRKFLEDAKRKYFIIGLGLTPYQKTDPVII